MSKSKGAIQAANHPGDYGFLSIEQAAQRLGVSRAFVRQQLLTHRLDVIRFGRLVRIPVRTLDRIVEMSRRPFAPHVPGDGR